MAQAIGSVPFLLAEQPILKWTRFGDKGNAPRHREEQNAMSEEQDVAQAPEAPEPTASQILEQIKEKQRELKAQAEPTAPASEPAPTSESVPTAPAAEPVVQDKPAEPAQESHAGAATGPEGKDKPEWRKWIEKKGFKSAEDMVRSMRELERELHRRSQGQGANAPQAAPPQPPIQQPAPEYRQPQAPLSEEELAKRYNLDPEDLRRVGPLAADIAANITAQKIGPLMAQLNRLNQEVARNAELQGLKEDPAFADPRVQFEMHRILETDPSILQIEPAPYRYAFNEALRTMGRRILEEGVTPQAISEVPSGQRYPTRPPVTAGAVGGAPKGNAGKSGPGPVNPNNFASLPLAEKRKVLEQLGALPKE